MQFRIKALKNISGLVLITCIALNTNISKAQTKIDGVSVVIGKNIVLDSDISKFKQEFENQTEGKVKISDCEMLEQLMLQKLLAHHAIIDSVVVSDDQINSKVNRNLEYFKQQFGSEEKMVKAYGFNDVADLRKEMYSVEKENALIAEEQKKITEKVTVTPEEVRLYYKGLKDKNELPEFPSEIKIAQIVVNASPTKEEEERIVNKLKTIKKELEDGANFKLKAIINSNAPAVAQNGGFLGTITKQTQFVKEFKEAAFSLDEGEISDPVKTIFGYHIIQVNKIRGNARDVSHILMKPEIPDSKLKETEEKVKKIRKDVLEGKITFEDAVKKFSEDKDTKNNGGLIINPYTNETSFELTRMDPSLYARVSDLKKGEITDPFYDETRGGEKMYKIILMKDRTETHKADLVEDYVKIQQLALQKKKQETITKWAKDKIQDTYIKLGEDKKKCKFDKNWKKEVK